MNTLYKNKKNLGFTIIEVVIACSIITVSMFALMQTAQKGIQLSNIALRKAQASFLLEEGVEAVKSIRDNDWTTISNLSLSPTKYHIFFNTSLSKWVLDLSSTNLSGSSTTYPIDVFDRTITISPVCRNGSTYDIQEPCGVLPVDPKTKKVIVEVSWNSFGSQNVKSISFYITDIFN